MNLHKCDGHSLTEEIIEMLAYLKTGNWKETFPTSIYA